MNILLVANWQSDVGYAWWLMENFWITIARHYHARDRRCILIYPKVTEIPAAIRESPIEVVELDFNDRSAQGRKRLRKLIQDNKIGAAYLTDKPYVSGQYAFLRQAGIRKIFVHDHTPGARTMPPLPRRLLKAALMRLPVVTADHYIGVTPYIRDRFINIARIPPRKCSFASNGIAPRDSSEDVRIRYRSLLGASDDTTVVVSTGRAHRYKGIDFIVRTAAKLIHQQGRKNLKFVHCGDGPHLEEFKRLAQELDIDGHFLFLGKRHDVRDLLQGCDVAIHASKGEVGYSLSILEYMDAGLVTFVPDRASVCQCIEHGTDGFIYRPDDVDSLARQLQQVVEDDALFASISRNARQTVRRDYRLEHTNAKLIEVLDKHGFAGSPMAGEALGAATRE